MQHPARTIGGDWNHGGHRVEPDAYDLVVGGDVVYDDLEWPAIGTALMRTLRAGGIALLADPGWVVQRKLRGATDVGKLFEGEFMFSAQTSPPVTLSWTMCC